MTGACEEQNKEKEHMLVTVLRANVWVLIL